MILQSLQIFFDLAPSNQNSWLLLRLITTLFRQITIKYKMSSRCVFKYCCETSCDTFTVRLPKNENAKQKCWWKKLTLLGNQPLKATAFVQDICMKVILLTFINITLDLPETRCLYCVWYALVRSNTRCKCTRATHEQCKTCAWARTCSFVGLSSNCYITAALWRQAIFPVVKNYGLKIGYKMVHKMKTGGYLVEIFA